jgi:Uma2 family endonuclease
MSQTARTRSKPGRRRSDQKSVALTVPSGVILRISPAGFWRLCQANPDLRLERSARGELIIMPSVGTDGGGRNAKLTTRLGVWAEADGTGQHFDSSTGYTLPNGATRSPDCSWIRQERWNALTPEQKQKLAPICPDFAVELCSPSDESEHIRAKMREYISQGLRLGWLIDPKSGTVEIYRPGRPVETLTKPAMISGEDVLPGFELDLHGILFD